MNQYFNNTQLIQNTLLPYFHDSYPLIPINKQYSKLNYEKYNTHLQPHGIFESYFLKAKTIYQRMNFINGKLDGLYQEWDENNLLRVRCEYKNYKIEGLYEHWYSNGQLSTKSWNKNGKLYGLTEMWNMDGTLWKTKIY